MYGVELTTEERIAEALEAIAKQQDIMTTVLSNMNTRDRMMLATVERIAGALEAQQPVAADEYTIALRTKELEEQGWKPFAQDALRPGGTIMRRPRQQPAPDASDVGDGRDAVVRQYGGRIIPADAPERETVRIWAVEEIRVAIHNVRDLVPPDVQSHSDAYCDGYLDALRHAVARLRADLIGGGPEPD